MTELLKTQTCPHCGYEVDDSHAEWDQDGDTVECDVCHKEYSVVPQYQFLGFEINKICPGCNELEDECYCDLEDTDPTEQAQAEGGSF